MISNYPKFSSSNRKMVFITFVFLLSILVVGISTARAQQAYATAYTRIAMVTFPKAPASSDISWVDPVSHIYFFADKTNKGVSMINTTDNALIGTIKGFVGVGPTRSSSGPNGVLVANNQLWAGDGNSTVKVVDLTTRTIIASISTGGVNRADEIGYDPVDKIIMVANDAETTPFVTFINATSRTVLGKILYPQAISGLEQPVWSPTDKLFYFNVPETTTNAGGEVNGINPKTMTIAKVYPLTNMTPSGLTMGPNNMLLVGGNTVSVMNASSGKIMATIPQVGRPDEVWYNPGDNRYYTAGTDDHWVGVIDASTNKWVTNIPTGTLRSVAVDPTNNHVFVPVNGAGVYVFADLSSLSSQVNSLTSSSSTLQSLINSLTAQVSTLSTIAYVALGVAVVLGVVAIVLSMRKRIVVK